jgi:hypothetical protein
MDNDRDLRNVILLLIKAIKLYRARAYALNEALSALMATPPTKRYRIPVGMVNERAEGYHRDFQAQANQQAQKIEQALAGDGEYLEILRAYASFHQRWEP